MTAARTILPGRRRGVVTAPPSKSHRHRVLIADFLAGGGAYAVPDSGDSDDVVATKRCLAALASGDTEPTLDVGESGSTYRFLAPVAAALGRRPCYRTAGRLASRPQIWYDDLKSGLHMLAGDVSSQFVTGLLFARPVLAGDSEIRFTNPLQSRGYVDMTLRVLRSYGIVVDETDGGFAIKGRQRFVAPPGEPPTEGDWSGATFWLAMNAIGSNVEVKGLDPDSAQPDRMVVGLLSQNGGEKDVSQCPDALPALAVVAGAADGDTRFVGVRRLRLKECDRLAAMAEFLGRLRVEVEEGDDSFVVHGRGGFAGGASIRTFGDHRIAMSAAVAATRADGSLKIDDAACSAKSYPGFFDMFDGLDRN